MLARLDAVQEDINEATALSEAIEAVVTAETERTQESVDTARALVDALPDSDDKTTLQSRLATVQEDINEATALSEAVAAVVTAETERTQEAVDTARALVDALPDSDDKTTLQSRLAAVQEDINEAEALSEAVAAVVTAETERTQESVDEATVLVDALPDSDDKTTLLARLDAVQEDINEAQALSEAVAAVVTAETERTQEAVDTARALVDALPDSDDKTTLLARLDAVQEDINEAEALSEAVAAVVTAETERTQEAVDTAKALVDALPDSDYKTTLLARLDAVQEDINEAEALSEAVATVVTAETDRTQESVDTAKALVDALPDSDYKTTLLARLDAVQEDINEAEALSEAVATVVTAETERTQEAVDTARALVDALPDSDEKTTLQSRLDAVQAELDAVEPPKEDVVVLDGDNIFNGFDSVTVITSGDLETLEEVAIIVDGVRVVLTAEQYTALLFNFIF